MRLKCLSTKTLNATRINTIERIEMHPDWMFVTICSRAFGSFHQVNQTDEAAPCARSSMVKSELQERSGCGTVVVVVVDV